MDRRTLHAQEVEEALRTEFGDLVSPTVIPQTVKFRDASVAGATILSFARTSDAAAAYRTVAAALLNGA